MQRLILRRQSIEIRSPEEFYWQSSRGLYRAEHDGSRWHTHLWTELTVLHWVWAFVFLAVNVAFAIFFPVTFLVFFFFLTGRKYDTNIFQGALHFEMLFAHAQLSCDHRTPIYFFRGV